jgi:hypothetical protein
VRDTHLWLHGEIDESQFAKGLKDLSDVIRTQVIVQVTDVETVIWNFSIGVGILVHRGSRKTRDIGSKRRKRTGTAESTNSAISHILFASSMQAMLTRT